MPIRGWSPTAVLVDCSRHEEPLIGRKTRIPVSLIRVFPHIRGSKRAIR